jgi:prephenate dehydrogenase
LSLGIIGFGAFGRLIADRMRQHASIHITDARPLEGAVHQAWISDLATICRCDIVVLAIPVSEMGNICRQIAPLLRPGTLVMDVGSVKIGPAGIMDAVLPPHVTVVATHPLFGPQSIKRGTRGLKMVFCPIRGAGAHRIAAFLRKTFGLHIIWATPEDHDREAAFTQGLTHLIARALLRMPLPRRITTRSFDLLWEAVSMVCDDTAGVTAAIANGNPCSAEARQAFFAELEFVRSEFETLGSCAAPAPGRAVE